MAENIKSIKQTKRNIMLGRIASLRNAGFTPDEIAIAVKLSVPEVEALIDKYGPAMDKVYSKA